MKAPSFDSTPEFQHFKEIMRGVIAMPKARLDELVKAAHDSSPRKGNPHAPGQKRSISIGRRSKKLKPKTRK